ncbi:MAG TPA: hypothetical protein VK624_09240 [Steroidobacteraceae bacterium]|nr:hypothetical protein [Steroidobacteraceae bacterium]
MPLPRPLMTGEVLDAAFRLFRAGLLRCLPYSGLAVLVFELPTVYATFIAPTFAIPGAHTFVVSHVRAVTWSIAALLATALLGVITLRLQAVSNGVRPRFRSELLAVFKRWPAALIATLGALGFPVALVSLGSVLSNILPAAGLGLVGVPLLWPTALVVVALPAFWCDGFGPFAAIAQALRVSRRRSWRMFGALLATGCMVAVFYAVSAIIVGMLSPMIGRADLFLIAAVSSMLWLVVGAIGVPFVVAVLIVAYEDLKLRERERRGATP